jgi:hypothetical protein
MSNNNVQKQIIKGTINAPHQNIINNHNKLELSKIQEKLYYLQSIKEVKIIVSSYLKLELNHEAFNYRTKLMNNLLIKYANKYAKILNSLFEEHKNLNEANYYGIYIINGDLIQILMIKFKNKSDHVDYIDHIDHIDRIEYEEYYCRYLML